MKNLRINPWLIWIIPAFFYAYENCLQVSLSTLINQLQLDFSISLQQVSIINACYFLTYAVAQLIVGQLLDRYGPRLPLTCAIVICSLGTLIFSLSQYYWMAIVGRFLIGFGSAFAPLACLQLSAIAFPARRFAMLTGLTLTFGMLGQMLGEAPLMYLHQLMGWRNMFLFFSFFSMALAALVFLALQNVTYQQIKTPFAILIRDFYQIMQKKSVWMTTVYAMLMYTPYLVISSQWGIPFLVDKLGISTSQSSLLLTYLIIGFAIGAPLLGWLADHFKNRKLILYLSSVGSSLAFCCLIYTQSSWLTGLLLLVLGIFISGFLPAFSIMKNLSDARYQTTSLGFMNLFNMLGAFTMLPMMAYYIEHFPINTSLLTLGSAYQSLLLICPICTTIAIFLLRYIPNAKANYGTHEKT